TLTYINSNLPGNLLRGEPHQMPAHVLDPDRVDPLGDMGAGNFHCFWKEIRRERTVKSNDIPSAENPTSRYLSGVYLVAYCHQKASGPVRIEYRGQSIFESHLRGFAYQPLVIFHVAHYALEHDNSKEMHICVHHPRNYIFAARINVVSAWGYRDLAMFGKRADATALHDYRMSLDWMRRHCIDDRRSTDHRRMRVGATHTSS